MCCGGSRGVKSKDCVDNWRIYAKWTDWLRRYMVDSSGHVYDVPV